MLPFPFEKVPLLLPVQPCAINGMTEARPRRKSHFHMHKKTFPLFLHPRLAPPPPWLCKTTSSPVTHFPLSFLSQVKQTPGTVTDHRLLCSMPAKLIPSSKPECTQKRWPKECTKKGAKLYLLYRRCLLRNQNKTLYKQSLLCQPAGKKDGWRSQAQSVQ